MRYTEDQLKTMCSPPSDTEKAKMENAEHMIKDALYRSRDLLNVEFEVFAQGSYSNNTNIKSDSDVDVCVLCLDNFFADYPNGKAMGDYNHVPGSLKYDDYYGYVYNALIDKFGIKNIKPGKKSIKIDSNTYHVNSDVVPAFLLKDYEICNSSNSEEYVEGIRYISQITGEKITNYPKIHYKNGVNKNKNTQYRYKSVVRILKIIKNDMSDYYSKKYENVSSFLLECLLFNVPNELYLYDQSLNERMKGCIKYIYNNVNEKWTEVNGILYLFNKQHSWTIDSVKSFMEEMWGFIK